MVVGEHYFLPRINVSFSAIPKTGNTSLKNYLFELEQVAGEHHPDAAENANHTGMEIHRASFLKDFAVSNIRLIGPDKSLKILVLRNPYHRIRSAWLNKLLFAQSDFTIFRKLIGEEFTPVDFTSVGDLNNHFELFARKLSNDMSFLDSDVHWRPQVSFFDNISDYDIVLETGNLSSLETVLSIHLGGATSFNQRGFPRFNETESKLLEHVGTDETWDLIASVYEKDFEALHSVGIFAPRPDTTLRKLEPLTNVEIQQEKESISRSRFKSYQRDQIHTLELELSDAKAKLVAIQDSWSWKLTAWLRWIGRKYPKNPKK